MLRADRLRLETAVPALLASLSGVPDVDGRAWTFSGGEHGKVQATFYNAKDAKDYPWLPCRLKDWGEGDPPRDPGLMAATSWHGFRHWKQNLYSEKGDTAAVFLQRIRDHLAKLGVAPKPAV